MVAQISAAATPAAASAACEQYPVQTPRYNWKRLNPAVVHFGLGAFHRAHQAVYFDDLAARGHTEWGVVGVGVTQPHLGRVLRRQDNLFAVIERSPSGSTARVIGSIVETLLLAEQRQAVLRRLVDSRTRLVTMTITGDGYRAADGSARGAQVFGAIVEALAVRRASGLPPFTVLSCDNLPDSGAAARSAAIATADERSPGLALWIADNVEFPSSMVDRITPSITPEDHLSVSSEFHLRDRAPVVTEPFTQWVIEDRFTDGRPPLDDVGALFVADVSPYKLIKSRLLNGAHSILGYLGCLAGLEHTDEVMADPLMAECITAVLRKEIAPLLPADIPGMRTAPYVDAVLERLRNTAIADPLSRLCSRGSTKMADYVLPSLNDAAQKRMPHPLLTLAVAAWCRYLQGTDLGGGPIDVNDARLAELQPLARQTAPGRVPLLEVADLFGDVGRDPAFAAEVGRLIAQLDARGVRGAIAGILDAA